MTHHSYKTKILDWLELIRSEHLFSAISNCWLIVLLSSEIESQSNQNLALMQMPLALRLFLATIIPAGLGICGICFNDILDLKHDKTFRPQSPIAAGRVSVTTASTLALASLLVALAVVVDSVRLFGTTMDPSNNPAPASNVMVSRCPGGVYSPAGRCSSCVLLA